MGEVALERPDVGAPDSESTACAPRLARFLRTAAYAAAFLSTTYIAVGLALRASSLYAAAGVTAALAAALVFAGHRARRGHVDGPVTIASFGLLITVVVVTPFVAFAYATLTDPVFGADPVNGASETGSTTASGLQAISPFGSSAFIEVST